MMTIFQATFGLSSFMWLWSSFPMVEDGYNKVNIISGGLKSTHAVIRGLGK